MKNFLFYGLLLSFLISPAFAAEKKKIGVYGDWYAYQLLEKGRKTCYMFSRPVRAEGKYKKRGDIFTLVTHSPADKMFDTVSVMAGYTYKRDSKVSVSIDGQTYSFFTDKETAWAEDEEMDRLVAKAIRSGKRMVIKGTSSRGTRTTDTYSLKGSGAAYKAISKKCR